LDGNFYQNGSTFTSLDQGSGTVYVKDSNGTVQTKTYTLSYQNPIRTYKASIGSSTETLVTKTLTKEVKKKTFTIVLGNSFTDVPVSPDVVTYQVGINYSADLYGTYNSLVSDVPSMITGITVNATGGYSITSQSNYYNVTTGTRTSGNKTQPTSAVTFNNTYQVEYDPQNAIAGETLTFETTNGAEIYFGGREDLLQEAKTHVDANVSKCKLTNVNACSSASCFGFVNNNLEIDI